LLGRRKCCRPCDLWSVPGSPHAEAASTAPECWITSHAATPIQMDRDDFSLSDPSSEPDPATWRTLRGPKQLWLVGCFVQPVGPIAYLALGRRPD
jgi:hypothetical protein